MKNFLYKFSLLALLLPMTAVSQNVIWTKVIAGQQEEYGNAICLDVNSNVIVTGNYQGFVYGGNFGMMSFGSIDAFVQKISAAGTTLWAKQFGSSGADAGHSVACDSAGNIYVAGTFSGTVSFDGATLFSPITGSSNFFLLKLDPDGNVLWRKAIPGYSSHRPKVAVDANDNLFFTGLFYDIQNFDSFSLDANYGRGYVAKIDNNNGSVLWITQFGAGFGPDEIGGGSNITTSNISTDPSGNIFVTGCFKYYGRFGSQIFMAGQSGISNSYVMKMNALGAVIWTKVIAGETEGTSVVADADSNVYAVGNYRGQIIVDNITYTAPAGTYSVYFEKLDSAGNLVWFKNYQTNSTSPYEAMPQLAIDSGANLFFRCLFTGNITFEGHNYTRQVDLNYPYNQKPQILANFDSNGNNLWANQYEKPYDYSQFGIWPDKSNNLAVDHNGLYFTSGSSIFDGVSYSLESGANIFTAKLSLTYDILGIPSSDLSTPEINLFPNPTNGKVTIDFSGIYDTADITVINSMGQLIQSRSFSNTDRATLDLTGPSGIYFLEMNLDGKRTVKRAFKL